MLRDFVSPDGSWRGAFSARGTFPGSASPYAVLSLQDPVMSNGDDVGLDGNDSVGASPGSCGISDAHPDFQVGIRFLKLRAAHAVRTDRVASAQSRGLFIHRPSRAPFATTPRVWGTEPAIGCRRWRKAVKGGCGSGSNLGVPGADLHHLVCRGCGKAIPPLLNWSANFNFDDEVGAFAAFAVFGKPSVAVRRTERRGCCRIRTNEEGRNQTNKTRPAGGSSQKP